MSQVEDWSDGDFDLEHTELRTDHTHLQDVHQDNSSHPQLDHEPSWDQDFPDDDPEDGSDEQTDTIKLSTAASSALKQLLQASKSSASATAPTDSLDDQLRPPALDLDRIAQYAASDHSSLSDAFGRRDGRACSTASLSTSASTSGRSMMGLSTDLTDPDSPHSKSDKVHQRSRVSSRSSGNARSDLDIQFSENDDALELDFELEPDMNNLSLCSSLSRARSNTSLSQVSRDIWDDDAAFNAPLTSTTHTSSSSLHPPAFPDHPPSVKSLSGESDADDEHEDVLDGLDLEGSIFEKHSNAPAQAPIDVKARLEAMLDLKRSGHVSTSADKEAQATDSDTAMTAGLVIDDDFDLSTSRIAARAQPSKLYRPANAKGSSTRLGVDAFELQADERRHPPRTASQHSDMGPPPGLVTRSEVRAPGRNRLRFKRSASDLQSHMSAAGASNTPSSSSNRPQNRGSRLQRKRSLPTMRTSPPANSPSSTAPAAAPANASTLSVRQRHNSSNSSASSASRFRGKACGSRLTDSTAASRARAAETAADHMARMQRDASAPARPSTPVSFTVRSTHQPASRISVNTRTKTRIDLERRGSSGESQPVARLLKRSIPYGNGAELDGIDDLPNGTTSSVVQSVRPLASSEKLNKNRAAPAAAAATTTAPTRENQPKRGGRRGKRNKPALIRSLGAGASPAHKSVKGMRWNAQALRWEGNEGVLRDFDQVIQSSTRPALISQMTGSSTSSALTHAAGYSSPLSPESSTLMNTIASGARVVGDMLFDPVQMRWIHKSGDEEEDVFAEFDDPLEDGDHSHDASALKLTADDDNTVRARRTRSTEAFNRSSNPWSRLSEQQGAGSSTMDNDTYERSLDRKNDQAIRRALSRGAFAPSVGIDRELWDACVQAEKRHAIEIEGCLAQNTASASRLRSRTRSHASDRAMTMDEIDRPRPHLYYLEKIAKSIIKPDGRS